MNHKLTFLRAISVTALAVGLSVATAQAQTSFMKGDLVVYRVGDGTTALSSAAAAVFLDEYTTTGTLVQSVAITGNGVNNLTESGSATSDGQLNVSSDGRYLALTGYVAPVGTTGIASTTATAAPRVVGIVGGGLIDTGTTLGTSFSGNNIRAAYTTDGNNIYAIGATTGTVNTTKDSTGNGTVVGGTTVTDLHDVVVSNGQVYVSVTGGGISTVSNGTTTSISFSSAPAKPYAFFFASLASMNDTLYVADGANIDKFSLSGGNYVSEGTIGTTSGNIYGLTGFQTGNNVRLYATTTKTIVTATDTTGAGGMISGSTALLATTGANQVIRGIAFLPNDIALPEPGVLPLVAETGALVLGFGLMRRRRKA